MKYYDDTYGVKVILQTLDTKMYREFDTKTNNIPSGISIDELWVTNHKVGDTIYFEYSFVLKICNHSEICKLFLQEIY
jgi:hypothetical protein